jgi:uncharacterized damage-inducible protein DinB
MPAFDPAARPDRSEYADFYAGYVGAVPDGDIVATIEREGARAVAMFRALPAERADFAYAPGKWTLREVVAHLADCERVFAYRALSFGRGDVAPLPGFDQEEWQPQAHAGDRPWAELVGELAAVRAATGYLVRSFAPADWLRSGVASDATVTVRALVWVIAGHELHHRRVLAERYGVSTPPVG